MHSTWKKIIQNHKGNYSKTLKIKTDFPIRTQLFFTRLKTYIVYIHLDT